MLIFHRKTIGKWSAFFSADLSVRRYLSLIIVVLFTIPEMYSRCLAEVEMLSETVEKNELIHLE
jgi:hypothetical protein